MQRTSTPINEFGVLWEKQGSFFTGVDKPGDYVVEVRRTAFSGRFVLAHELAHRIVDKYMPSEQLASLDVRNLKLVVDDVASHILLPSELLLLALGPKREMTLELPLLVLFQRTLRVTLSCLIKRLSDLVEERQLVVRNCALVAAPAVSTKHKTNYAPRVVVSCTPKEWFLPPNKRLASLGLSSLLYLWNTVPPFKQSNAEDIISIWRRSDWRKITTSQRFDYIFYEPEERRRVMLATFGCPSDFDNVSI